MATSGKALAIPRRSFHSRRPPENGLTSVHAYELRRRMHHPIPEQGRWLASVVRGHLAYYAVPGNTDAVVSLD